MAKHRRPDPDEPPPHDDTHAPAQTASGLNPFLKSDHIAPTGPTRLRLTGWTRRSTGQFGPQIIVEVTLPDGRTFDFAMKEGSPNHRMLWRGMGADERKWAGSLVVEREQFQMRGGRMSNWTIGVREVEADNPPF